MDRSQTQKLYLKTLNAISLNVCTFCAPPWLHFLMLTSPRSTTCPEEIFLIPYSLYLTVLSLVTYDTTQNFFFDSVPVLELIAIFRLYLLKKLKNRPRFSWILLNSKGSGLFMDENKQNKRSGVRKKTKQTVGSTKTKQNKRSGV